MNRIKDIVYYSFKQCGSLSRKSGKNRFVIFFDMIKSYFEYGIWTNQYSALEFYNISSKTERAILAQPYAELNRERDRQHDFIAKFESTPLKHFGRKFQQKRLKAFKEFLLSSNNSSIGSGLKIGRNAIFVRDHLEINLPLRPINIGNNLNIFDNVYIDFMGGLTIGDNVSISENALIYTHSHDPSNKLNNLDWRIRGEITPTTLEIGDGVGIGARAMILAECKSIGRGALIGAGAVVRTNVPPYSIVIGNPAKVIGFRLTPEEILEFEAKVYPEEKRIPRETMEKNYKKHFENRIKEIRDYLR